MVSDGAVTDMDRKSIRSKGSSTIALHNAPSHTKSAIESYYIIYRQVVSAIPMRITYFLFLVVKNGNLSNSINMVWAIAF